jgi:hypothetical protein
MYRWMQRWALQMIHSLAGPMPQPRPYRVVPREHPCRFRRRLLRMIVRELKHPEQPIL